MGQESLVCPHSLKLVYLQLIWGQQITHKKERSIVERTSFIFHQHEIRHQTCLVPACPRHDHHKIWSGRNNENNKLRMKTTWARPAIFLIILVFVNIKQWLELCVKLCREIGRPIFKRSSLLKLSLLASSVSVSDPRFLKQSNVT